jgi:hypothetical protein
MDLTKAFEFLAKQAVAAAEPQVAEFDPTKCHVVRMPDGAVHFRPGVPPWRKHSAFDLETIAAFADRFKTDGPAIWVNRNGVVCLVNDSDRRERVEMKLSFSKQIQQLQTLEAKQMLDQRGLIFMLRTVFRGCLGRAPELIDVLRQVRFTVGSEGEQNIGKGKSSMGKTVRAEMTGVQNIPEYVTVSVPIFDNGSLVMFTADVECVLEVLEQTQNFQFFPVPGRIEVAINQAETQLGETVVSLLEGESFPIYRGQP